MNKELRDWLDAHHACEPGMTEMDALHITDMQDAYNRASPESLVWAVTQEGVMTQKQCVEFSLYCVRQIEDKLTDERSRAVIPALERWLTGDILPEEMKAVYHAADHAIYHAADHAAYAAVDAACAACAAVDAACAACAACAAVDAAYAAAYASRVAAREEQADWIRKNISFESLNLELKDDPQ